MSLAHPIRHHRQAHARPAGTSVQSVGLPPFDEFFFAEELPLRAAELQEPGPGHG